jgi:hypothetical protein
LHGKFDLYKFDNPDYERAPRVEFVEDDEIDDENKSIQ